MSAEEYRSKAAKPQVHTLTRWEYEQMTRALNRQPMPAPSEALQEAVRPTTLNSPILLPEDETIASPSVILSEAKNPFPPFPVAAEAVQIEPGPSTPSARLAPGPRWGPADRAGELCSEAQATPFGGFRSAQDDKTEGRSTPVPADRPLPLEGVEKAPDFRYIGELFRTYLLVEQDDALLLIDKHAAHERINFERLLAQGTRILGQTLLRPLACPFDPEEAALLLEHRALLLSLGYDLDDLGQGDLLLRQIPSDIRESDAAAALSEIAGHLRDGRLDTPQRLRDEALHTIACKAAIKAGYVTDPAELQALAKTVLSRDDLKYCPHGRPICTFITKKQIEKQFKRIT